MSAELLSFDERQHPAQVTVLEGEAAGFLRDHTQMNMFKLFRVCLRLSQKAPIAKVVVRTGGKVSSESRRATGRGGYCHDCE